MEKITLRYATFNDAEMVFEWRNAFETRQYFFDPRPLEKIEHLKWFEESLKMSQRCLLIAEENNNAIGVLRFDLADKYAEINIYLRPGLSGRGLGTRILTSGTEWIKEHHPEIQRLHAKVIPDNIGSKRAFEKAGFNVKMEVYEKQLGKLEK